MDLRAPDCDLHPYIRDPDKARAIIDACIDQSRKDGKTLVRMIHGKGTGDFKILVHSYLAKHPDVEGFMLCDPLHGGSGATWVHIVPLEDEAPIPEEKGSGEKSTSVSAGWRWLFYLIFIIAVFLIIPQWFARLIMVAFILFLEFRIRGEADSSERSD